MANEVELGIILRADGSGLVGEIKLTEKELKKLEKTTKKTGAASRKAGKDSQKMARDMRASEKSAKKLSAGMQRLGRNIGIALAAVITGSIASFGAIIVEGENLKASLNTVTGSTDAAAEAFDRLEGFTSKTPFSLAEVVNAFIKLKAFGLDPSEAAIESYGNTASAMGKSLEQMIEAVADAATGEFERLKEFGIKSRSEGDKVIFTFRGIETEIEKSADAIEGYLKNIGETEFAGATAEKAKTLGGALSNLGDAWSSLGRTIGEAGLSKLLSDAARNMTQLLNDTKNLIAIFSRTTLEEFTLEKVDAEIKRVQGEVAAIVKDGLIELRDFSPLTLNVGVAFDAFKYASLVGQLDKLIDRKRELEQEALRTGTIDRGPVDEPPPPVKPPSKEALKLAAAIEKRVKALELEAEQFGKTAAEAELYELQLQGASQAQIARAGAALASVEAEEAFAAAVSASEEAVKAENLAQIEWTATQEEAAEKVRQSIDPLRELNQELEKLQLLRAGGFIDQAEFEAQAAVIEQRKDEAIAGVSAISQFTIQAARNMQSTLSSGIFEFWKTGTQNMAEQFKDMIARLIIEAASAKLLQTLFGDFGNTGQIGGAAGGIGSFITSLFAHQGAVVGRSGGTNKQVSPAVFAGAKRYHTGGFPGLAQNEVPIIARKRQEIITRDDPRHSLNGGLSGGIAAATARQGEAISRAAQASDNVIYSQDRFQGRGNQGNQEPGKLPALATNEVPIIVERGEEVLTEKDPRNALNGGTAAQYVSQVAHMGSVIGSAARASKRVDPSAFSGARRFHDGGFPGMAANDIPVLPKQQAEPAPEATRETQARQAESSELRVTFGADMADMTLREALGGLLADEAAFA